MSGIMMYRMILRIYSLMEIGDTGRILLTGLMIIVIILAKTLV